MKQLLAVRKAIKDFFTGYDLFVIPCLKFILAFFVFVMINRNYMYMEVLSNVFILVVLALLCAVLPVNSIVVISAILIVLHCFAADLIIGIGAFCLILILLILLLRFAPKDSLAVVLTPFAFLLNIPAAIPIGLGMLREVVSILAGICGVAVYCFLDNLPHLAKMAGSEDVTKIELVQEMIQDLIGHEELILSCIVFSAVILIVHLIRKSLTKYTYLISVAVGTVVYILLRIVGSRFLGVDEEPKKVVTGALLSFIICMVIAFFVHCADYKRTKLLQFEDDEYYYYVKAVPKQTPDYVEDEEDDDEDDTIEKDEIEEIEEIEKDDIEEDDDPDDPKWA